MAVHRFYVESLATYPSILLEGPEVHHALKVLRVRIGEGVELFDGIGNVASGSIVGLEKRAIRIELSSRHFAPRDHDGRLHFVVAMPKGDRQRSVVEKLVELGADSLRPIHTRYSVAEIDEGNCERLVRYGLESCKQCCRNRNIAILPSMRFDAFLEEIRSQVADGITVFVLHPTIGAGGGFPSSRNSGGTPEPRCDQVLFVVGPEGGFTEEEVAKCVASGGNVLGLGERILRVETAVSVAAVLGQQWLSRLEG